MGKLFIKLYTAECDFLRKKLIRQPLFYLKRGLGADLGDADAGFAVAVEFIGLVAAVLELPGYRVLDLLFEIIDVDDVRPTFAASLACADVYDGDAQI